MMVGVDSYFAHLLAKGYAEGTIRWHRNHLEKFAQYLSQNHITLSQVTTEHIQTYLALLQQKKLQTATLQAHITAIKGLFTYLYKLKQIPHNPAQPIEPPLKEKPLPKVLTEEEVLLILASPDLQTLVGLRDRAILELLYSSGIRRQELVNLDTTDLDIDKGILLIKQGKNRKDRLVPVGEKACKFVEAYLKLVRQWFLRKPSEPALFLDSQKGKRLNPNTIEYLVKKYLQKSGVKKKASTHTMRHSMATHLLKNGADIRYIQIMLGHARIDSTEVYTHLAIDDLKEIHRRSHPHGKR